MRFASALLLLSCTAADPTSQSLASKSSALGEPRPVMVYLKAQADLTVNETEKVARATAIYHRLVAHAESTQAPVIALLDGYDYQAFHITNAVFVKNADDALVAKLNQLPQVERVGDDFQVALRLPPKSEQRDTEAGIEASLVATKADQVWRDFGARGQGVVVGGQDTGVDWTHPALKHKYRGWDGSTADHRYSWHDSIHSGGGRCGANKAEPCDDDQHGTHTVGTMLGDDGVNQIGMAPDAKWIACRNMDRGVGKPSTYIECFEWFLAPYPQGGNPRTDGDPAMAPDVVNNSWGCDGSEGCRGDEIVPAIRALKAAGTVIVASAGNSGSSCGSIDSQPGTVSNDVISVGAYDHRSDRIAGFSSRGPSVLDDAIGPHVAAPGVGIRSCVPGGGYQGGWSGTSMAGPHVAGEVALIISANPELRGKPDAIAAIVKGNCTAKTSTQSCGGVPGSAVPNNTWGYGIIDAYRAVTAAVGSR